MIRLISKTPLVLGNKDVYQKLTYFYDSKNLLRLEGVVLGQRLLGLVVAGVGLGVVGLNVGEAGVV